MLAARVRSGVEETIHDGAIAVVSRDGRLLASTGDTDRPFFLRSAAKPFQAAVAQESGAGLTTLELALASASHAGDPVHISIVTEMLRSAGLDESSLGCPSDWPISDDSWMRVVAAGARGPRRIWNNCSGKHTAWLRACLAQGWPIDGYLSPDHPLQKRIFELVADQGNHDPGPVGVDGCGAPVMRTTVSAMARLFAGLGSDERMTGVFTAMHRYPALVSGPGFADAAIATALDAVAKGGAEGCLGVALADGTGIAVKSWDGSRAVAGLAAVETLDRLGRLTRTARSALEPFARPPVLGGGMQVGALEARFELESS